MVVGSQGLSIVAVAGAQSPAPDTKVASAPARRPAAMRVVARPGLRGHLQVTPANTSPAPAVIHGVTVGGTEIPARADVLPGTAHTQGDHEMLVAIASRLPLAITGDSAVPCIYPGRLGSADHDNRPTGAPAASA